jgi:hypothetical protein
VSFKRTFGDALMTRERVEKTKTEPTKKMKNMGGVEKIIKKL